MSDSEFLVYTESLDAAASSLDNLARLAEEKMIEQVHSTLHITGGSADAVFGTFDAAREVAAKQSAYYQTAHASTQALIKALRDAAEGTRKIAANYRNAEAASRAAVQDVAKLLNGSGEATTTPVGLRSTSVPPSSRPALSEGSNPVGGF